MDDPDPNLKITNLVDEAAPRVTWCNDKLSWRLALRNRSTLHCVCYMKFLYTFNSAI